MNQNQVDERLFCSKILLFGEYSIIQNSMALSIPFPLFNGKLLFKTKKMEDGTGGGNSELFAFAEYLRELLSQKDLNFTFDLTSFLFDIGQGLVFSSSIPQGYGVGSSGALVAALFHRYGTLKNPLSASAGKASENSQILELREAFSKMESHFHGKSSGIDPLISYLNIPLLLRSQVDLGVVQLPHYEKGEGAIFLINTGRPRRTEPLVNLFLEKCKESNFSLRCQKEFIPITNQCITHFLEGQTEELYHSFRALSGFQYENLLPMIPSLFRKVWQRGLDQGDYFLKLCGAGGGGLFLGITQNFQKTCERLRPHQLRMVLPI